MAGDQSELAEGYEIEYVRRKLGRVLGYAISGYYRTVFNDDKVVSKAFLDIIKEAHKALVAIDKYRRGGGSIDARY